MNDMLRRALGGVLFQVGEELCFLPASVAVKLMPAPRVARMPGAPAELRGVALVDGEMIPVVDVHVAADASTASPDTEGDAMLVCKVHGESVGFVGLHVVATGFFDVAKSGEIAFGERVARSFDVAAVIAKVREGRWAV
jgi:chemotaxis signal transduction protein